jgi:hypothetical protein
MKLLVAAGADPRLKAEDGTNLLMAAAQHGSKSSNMPTSLIRRQGSTEWRHRGACRSDWCWSCGRSGKICIIRFLAERVRRWTKEMRTAGRRST